MALEAGNIGHEDQPVFFRPGEARLDITAHHCPEPVERRHILREPPLHPLDQLGKKAVRNREKDRLLVLEVLIDRRLRNTDMASNIPHRDLRKPALGEQRPRRIDDLEAPFGRRQAAYAPRQHTFRRFAG